MVFLGPMMRPIRPRLATHARRLMLAGALAGLCLGGPARAGEAFLKGFDDVPLPGGFTTVDSPAPTVFDSPYGRLAEAYARGPGPLAEARAFYARTLPQLGWTALPGEGLAFARGDERLSLEFTAQGQTVVIHYALKPN